MLFIEKLPTRYDAGLASVTAGQKTVTPTDAAWLGNAWGDDLFCLPSQPLVPLQRIETVNEDGTLTLAVEWPGTTETEVAYEIRYVGIIERSTAQTRKVLEQLSAIEANGRGLFYRFSDQPEDADPGAGRLRLNAIDLTGATAVYIDNEDANGAAVAAEIDTWTDSSSVIKGVLWLRSVADPSSARAYALTGAVVDGTGYRKLTVEHIGGSGSFAADEALMVAFSRAGDRGDAYQTDATVDDMDGLTAHDAEDDGFRVFVRDLGDGQDHRSGVVSKAGAGWEVIALYTGPTGATGPAPNLAVGTTTTGAAGSNAEVQIAGANPNYSLKFTLPRGDQGYQGWAIEPELVADGAVRQVIRVADWIGGAGAKPGGAGKYLGADGLVDDIGDAVNVMGGPGPQGPRGVAWKGAWSDVVDYQPGDLVTDPDANSDPAIWIALTANSDSQPRDNAPDWAFFPGTFGLPADYGLITAAADNFADYGTLA